MPVSLHWLQRNSKQHKRNLRHDSVAHTQASRNNFSIPYSAWYTYIQHWHTDFWRISWKLWKVPKGIYLWVIALFMTYLWVIALYPSTLCHQNNKAPEWDFCIQTELRREAEIAEGTKNIVWITILSLLGPFTFSSLLSSPLFSFPASPLGVS